MAEVLPPQENTAEIQVDIAQGILLNAYQRYAWQGADQHSALLRAQTLYTTTIAKQAEQFDEAKPGGGMDFVCTQDELRKDTLLSLASPERLKARPDVFLLYVGASLGGLATGHFIPGSEYVPWLAGAIKYAEGEEPYRRAQFQEWLNEYYLQTDTPPVLTYRDLLTAKTDREISFIDEFIQPEINKRRRRILARAGVVAAGVLGAKTFGLL